MAEDIPEKLTFTQAEFDRVIGERVLRERDKNVESFNLLTAENETLKGKLSGIEVSSLVEKAGLAQEWTSKLTGKTIEEVKAEILTIKTLVEKSKPAPEKVGADTNPANVAPMIITRESLKKMSPEQINANWVEVQKALAAGI